MPTASNSIYKKSDGLFTVVAERRKGRKDFRTRAWFKGNSRIEEPATTEKAAIAAANNIWLTYQQGLIDNQLAQPQNLGELMESFLERKDIRKTTLESYKSVLVLMNAQMGEATPLKAIRKHQIDGWLSNLDCKEISKASYLRTIRAVFNWAISKGWMNKDPSQGLKFSSKQERRCWLEEDEWGDFLNACTPSFRARAAFVLETGLRRGELTNARWSWIRKSNGRPCLCVQSDSSSSFVTKSGRSRAIPLSDKAQQILNAARATWGDDGYIFFKDKVSWPNLTRECHKACRKAGVTDVDFHGLRRSAGARWMADGLAIQDVSTLLGHADIGTTMKHYGGVSNSHLTACMDLIDKKALSVNSSKLLQFPPSTKQRIPA